MIVRENNLDPEQENKADSIVKSNFRPEQVDNTIIQRRKTSLNQRVASPNINSNVNSNTAAIPNVNIGSSINNNPNTENQLGINNNNNNNHKNNNNLNNNNFQEITVDPN